jgi:uncharacterized protein (DUF1800 family)
MEVNRHQKTFLSVLFYLASCFAPPAFALTNTPNAQTPPISHAAAARFLEQATWGPTNADIANLQKIGFENWFREQRSATESTFPPNLVDPTDSSVTKEFLLHNAVNGSDQLRQRMAFTLGQIWVTSGLVLSNPIGMDLYQQFLQDNAFSNYRQLMEAETLNPSMGYYLNLAGNWKAMPWLGSRPNENYARELLQLFTIGTVMLNVDGTPQVDAHGNQIPTYDQAQIAELARALTGWYYDVPKGMVIGRAYYRGHMLPHESYHDSDPKVIFGTSLPGGQTAKQDLEQTLDIIFNHPNVPPFVSTRLIQHFVTSNPSPDYVRRVARVFIDSGRGVRGDLFATTKAVLLDPEARLGDDNIEKQPTTGGHLREPILYVLGMLRALGAKIAVDSDAWSPWDTVMEQRVYFPVSVFSYYSPFYQIPGSALLGPEFQILSTSSALWRVNFINALLGGQMRGVSLDLTPYMKLADHPSVLVDAVDQAFMRGQMPTEMKTEILSALSATIDKGERVRTAIYLTTTSGLYQVEH